MSELIPIVPWRIGAAEVPSVDGRILHANLGIARQYADWIRTWLRKANLLEHRDYEVFHTDVKNPTGGRPSAEYALSVDAAKCIAMMAGGEQGDKVRAYFLEREQQALASEQPRLPKLHNPMNQVMIETVVRVDTLEYETAELRKENARLSTDLARVDSTASRADSKADLALADAHRMPLDVFLAKNGLLVKFPPSQYPGYITWLKTFCRAYGLTIAKEPVVGKPWPDENAYPLAALLALVHAEQTKPQQAPLLTIVTPPPGA